MGHYCFGRVAEHVCHSEVNRTYTICLLEYKPVVACGFSDNIKRAAFSFGNFAYIFDVFFADNHTHALLAFIADNLFCGECRVAYRQRAHVDFAACWFNEFGKCVKVTAGTVVVYWNYGVGVAFSECAYNVAHSFLHFRVGALYGIEFYRVVIAACFYGRNGSAAHADAVVVAAQYHNFLSCFRLTFEGILSCSETHTSGKHYHFVVSVHATVFLVFESEKRAANQWLTEFVAEVGCSVRCFYKYFGRCLIEPYPRVHHQFPTVFGRHAGVWCHVNGGTCYGQTCLAASKTVTNLASATGCRSVERFYGCREVVSLGF